MIGGKPLGAFEVEESAFIEGAGLVLEGATAGIRVKGIAFTVAALLVRRFAAKLSEFCADVGVVESAIFGSGASSSCEVSAKVLFCFWWWVDLGWGGSLVLLGVLGVPSLFAKGLAHGRIIESLKILSISCRVAFAISKKYW